MCDLGDHTHYQKWRDAEVFRRSADDLPKFVPDSQRLNPIDIIFGTANSAYSLSLCSAEIGVAIQDTEDVPFARNALAVL